MRIQRKDKNATGKIRPGIFFISLLLLPALLQAQTLGGNAAYNFLSLPNTPQLSALGGVNISNISNDLGMAFNNPSLLRDNMSQQLHVSFNNMFAGVKNYHAMFAYSPESLQTNFALGVHFLDYGNITQTDPSGNIYGDIHPLDCNIQLSASRHYESKWYYGIAVKFIRSAYGIYRSSAIAMDAGVSYFDSTRGWQASLLLKTMGTQLTKYMNTTGDDLPFDVQLGVTKRLSNAPVQFSLTAHHLQQFNIMYDDTSFNISNGSGAGGTAKGFTLDKVFRHLVMSGQAMVAGKVELTLAYNYLLHKELGIDNTSNGFTGISLGVGVLFKKIQIRYARSNYQNNLSYNQLGLNLALAAN